jgi:capsule polysaccharide modification protein KpsS
MDMPYITEMQEKDKHLITDIKKENHKYELNKIERRLVMTRSGNIFIPTAVYKDEMVWYHEYLYHPGAAHTEATI